MVKILLGLIFLLTGVVGHGQQELKAEFEQTNKFYEKGDFQNAIKGFTAIIGKATDPVIKKLAYVNRALAKNGLYDSKSAISDFDKAIELDPEDLFCYDFRGQLYAYINIFDSATRDFQFVLSKDSLLERGQSALLNLARISHAEGKLELSIKYYDKYILLVPDNAEAYFNRGVSKGMVLNTQGAIQDYDKAIIIRADYMEAYANRGVEKINLVRSKGNLTPTKEQLKDPCADLKRAKQLGDTTVDDMIYIHCQK